MKEAPAVIRAVEASWVEEVLAERGNPDRRSVKGNVECEERPLRNWDTVQKETAA